MGRGVRRMSGQHKTGCYHIHPYPLPPNLHSKVSCKTDKGRGGCDIAAVAPHRAIDLGCEDVDDRAPVLFSHDRYSLPGAVERPLEHDIDLLLMFFPGDTREVVPGNGEMGVINEDIQTGKPLLNKLKEEIYRAFVRDIGPAGDCSAPCLVDLPAGLLSCTLIFIVVQDDRGACLCQGMADRLAQIITPACDKGCLSLKILVHQNPLSPF